MIDRLVHHAEVIARRLMRCTGLAFQYYPRTHFGAVSALSGAVIAVAVLMLKAVSAAVLFGFAAAEPGVTPGAVPGTGGGNPQL